MTLAAVVYHPQHSCQAGLDRGPPPPYPGDTIAYSINGEPYATATYDPGTVPITGCFGFAVYHREDLLVENIRITPL